MKTLIVALLMLVAVPGWGQKVDSKVFKGANVILIKSMLPESEAYTAVGKKLIDLGYTFQGNEQFKTFKTDEKGLKESPMHKLVSTITINGDVIKVTGRLAISYQGSNGDIPLEYRASGLTMHKAGVLRLIDIANGISGATGGGEIAYEKQ